MAHTWATRGTDVASILKRFDRLNPSRWIGIGRRGVGRLLPFAGKHTEGSGHDGGRRRYSGDSSEARPVD